MATGGGNTTLRFAPGVGLVRMNSGERSPELKAFKPGE
jgi:hypothetical protein